MGVSFCRLAARRVHILPKTELSGLSGFHLFSLDHWQKKLKNWIAIHSSKMLK
jgi:hypothetical protein